jgi:antitoxin MazE
MSVAHKARIVATGSLCEIHLPQSLLEQAGIERHIQIEFRNGDLVIRAAQHPRAGWEEAFRHIVEDGEDGLLDEELCLTEWEINKWVWE